MDWFLCRKENHSLLVEMSEELIYLVSDKDEVVIMCILCVRQTFLGRGSRRSLNAINKSWKQWQYEKTETKKSKVLSLIESIQCEDKTVL